MGMAITTLVVVAYQHDYQVIRLLNEVAGGVSQNKGVMSKGLSSLALAFI